MRGLSRAQGLPRFKKFSDSFIFEDVFPSKPTKMIFGKISTYTCIHTCIPIIWLFTFSRNKVWNQPIILLKKFEIFLTWATTNTRLVNEIIMLPPDRIQFLTRTKCGSARIDDGIIVCDELIIKFKITLYRFDIFNHLETSIDSFFSWLCINKVSNHADTHKICVTSNATNTLSL